MHKNLLFASLLFVFAAVIACKKTVCPEVPGNRSCQFMDSKFYFIDGSWYKETYTFNAAGYLTAIIDTRQDGGLMSRQEYIYENNRLVAENIYSLHSKVAEYKFIYSGGQLAKMEYIENRVAGDVLVYDRTFEYTNNRLLRTTDTNYYFKYASYNVFTYTGRNISRVRTYKGTTNELTEDVELVYDEKKNPFAGFFPVGMGLARYDCPNNVVLTKEHVRNGDPSNTEYAAVFTYNANGYPVAQRNRQGRTDIHEQSFEYDCR